MTTPERIELTKDAEQQAKLRRKLAEYRERLAFQAPEVEPHETFKLMILSALLEDGVVDMAALRLMEQEVGWFDTRDFDSAVTIIAAYNDNDLSHLRDGTGLR